jgi:hypothetical protein
MNSNSHKSSSKVQPEAVPGAVEATLRLIAALPAPDGLEDRVVAGLRTAPRTARILHWPAGLRPTNSWMRGAAAAAIVFVVAGGGWGIYTRVQPTQPARVIVMPPRVGATGGFSNAGAMRTPQTLNGPVVANPVAAQPVQIKPLKKVPAPIAPMKHSRFPAGAVNKTTAQPAVSAAK